MKGRRNTQHRHMVVRGGDGEMEFKIVKKKWKREKETRWRLKKRVVLCPLKWCRQVAGREWGHGTDRKRAGASLRLVPRQQARALVAVEGAQSSQCQDLCVSGHWETKLHLKGTDGDRTGGRETASSGCRAPSSLT